MHRAKPEIYQRIPIQSLAYIARRWRFTCEEAREIMKWSKLKQQIESRFADCVCGHAAIHITRYGPGLSSTMTRGWLTWDGKEILSLSTITWLQAERIEAANAPTSDTALAIHERLQQRGRFSRFDLTNALASYLNMSIDDAVASPNQLIRALAMLDRRIGKRRLAQLGIDATAHPFVKQLYELRCAAEQLHQNET